MGKDRHGGNAQESSKIGEPSTEYWSTGLRLGDPPARREWWSNGLIEKTDTELQRLNMFAYQLEAGQVASL